MQGYGFMDDVYDRRAQRERQAGIDAQNTELHEAKMRGLEKAEERDALKQGYAAMQAGFEPDEETFKIMERYNLLPGEGMAKVEQDLQTVESIMQSGDLSQFRSSKGLDALNSLLAPDINSDRKGNPLPGRRRITDIMPGQKPGTAVFELAGEYEDGTPFSGQPMTEGRGRAEDGDNAVLQQYVGDIAKKLQAQRAILNEYKNNPEFKTRLDKYAKAMGWASDKKPIKLGINDRLLDPDSNEVLVDADPQARLGGGSTPAILQETNAIFKRLPKKEGEDDNARWLRAHTKASRKSSTDPREAASNFYKGVLTNLLKDTYDEEERTAAQQYANKLTEQFIGTYFNEDERAAAKPGRRAKSAQQGGPRSGEVVDGYRFNGGNPNDPGSWESIK